MENNICHRCGKPIYELIDFGSNQDGTINTDYCHNCYVNGIFVDHGISLEEKIEKNIPPRKNNQTMNKGKKNTITV
ncbi:zinc ribbon domain-containing protein [Maribacter sp. CXY002]|uniref:zinc ribbon domain-containing protein n=1 Tax=Maribacter luteocoastalis TaxID=3407671 RepID=UPI003B67A7DA